MSFNQPSYILSASSHNVLSPSLREAVEALRVPPPLPSQLECKLTGPATSIPYFLLHGCAYHDTDVRGEKVLNTVIQTALNDSGLTPQQIRSMGLFIGSSSFEIATEETRFAHALTLNSEAHPLAECGMGNFAEKVRDRFHILGPDFSFNTACTSSANALWYAHLAINAGLIDHALILATEFANDLTTYGFQGLQLISRSQMRPFDVRRDGLVLGESCTAVVVGKQRPAQQALSIVGGANLCDTFSMSITHEDGSAVAEVINQALAAAQLKPEHIQAIKCHGTSTTSGDAAEAKGMLQVFADLPPCTALKPFIGHTLGACGLTELALFGGAARAGFLPGITSEGDSEHLGFELNQAACALDPGFYLLNYFGFGGNNTSLVLKHEVAL